MDPYRFGVIGGTGIGGIMTLEAETKKAIERGVSRVSPLMVTMTIPNMIAGNISIETGAKGISMGIIAYVAFNLITGKAKEKKVSVLMYVLAVLFILKYIFL